MASTTLNGRPRRTVPIPDSHEAGGSVEADGPATPQWLFDLLDRQVEEITACGFEQHRQSSLRRKTNVRGFAVREGKQQ